MHTLKAMTVLLATVFAAASIATAAGATDMEGLLIYKRQQTVADTSMDPGATTVGQFFRDYPRGAPERLPMVPTKEVEMLKVRLANGKRVEVMQDWEDSRDLAVGDKVSIKRVDGKDKVVRAK